MRIPLGPDRPIRLDWTLASGQMFRWRQEEDRRWCGSLRGTALAIGWHPEALTIETAGDPIAPEEVRAFLGLDNPLPAIRRRLSNDSVLRRAFDAFYGLRVVRQDPWEGLVAFICSSHNALFRIEQMMACLAARFGRRLVVAGHSVHTFPSAECLAELGVKDLAACRLGYRDAYVLEAARWVASGRLDVGGLASASHEAARQALMAVPGVGPKVSDCVLLLALGKTESAFPVDVWVRRAILRHYRGEVEALTGVPLPDEEKGLTARQYGAIVRWARWRFGADTGYAQAYLFFASREGMI